MNRIKSIFVTTASMYWFAVTNWAFIKGFSTHELHFGLLLASIVPVLFLARLYIYKTARTSRNPLRIMLLVSAGVGLEILSYIHDENSLTLVELTIISFVFWLIYIYWYSVFLKRQSGELIIGN